ncbi:MAG: hypothetical protein K0A92_04530 [Methyloprofundus sp.]|nr:hypothetical protein [Methyloprofundus sp.]
MTSACSMRPNLSVPTHHDLGLATEASIHNATVNVDAPSWLWEERIRYRLLYSNPTAIAYYNLDRWEASVPTLLEHRLHIAAHGKPINLKIQLLQFEQQFESANHARVVMLLKVHAFSGESTALLGQRVFKFAKNTPTPDAAGAIKGFVDLTKQANNELSSWVAALLGVNKAL